MTLAGWRIVRQEFVRSAFSGEGARLYGGRWNSRGVPLVYLAANPALAVLEIVVHTENPGRLLERFRLIRAEFDERLVEELDVNKLPRNWRRYPSPRALQLLGDRWAGEKRSPILRVPSAVVPIDWNYLLNPLHPAFPEVRVGKPEPFRFDPRLAKPH